MAIRCDIKHKDFTYCAKSSVTLNTTCLLHLMSCFEDITKDSYLYDLHFCHSSEKAMARLTSLPVSQETR